MTTKAIIRWLLEGDVAIQYQTYRDLLGEERPDLQQQIAHTGWGAGFLAAQRPDGHWGQRFYQPKWTSTHYTLLDLRLLNISPDLPSVQNCITQLLQQEKSPDGGINPHTGIGQSDVCVNGMFLNYACYFGAPEKDLESIIDFTLSQHMPDGGFNCRSNRSGAVHSSLHTTLSICEGLWEYERQGYTYRLAELQSAAAASREFILLHQFYLSDRTGKIIHPDFLKFPFPGRWKYNILRALDHFQNSGQPWDSRMQPALDVLLKKQTKDGRWKLNAKHPGQTHFEMEKAGQPSRWNTLRAMRVLRAYSS
jgi:hypothetical protein